MNSLPPEVERRRRLVTRTLPLALDRPGRLRRRRRRRRARLAREGRRRALRRGLGAKGLRGDVRGAERPREAQVDRTTSTAAYREAEEVATAARRSKPAPPATPPRSSGDAVVPVADRRSRPSPSARSKPSSTLPYDDGGIAWDPSLVFPGLRPRRAPGEPSRTGAAGADPRRATGPPLAEGPGRRPRTPARQRRDRRHRRSRRSPEEDDCAALARHGFPPETPVGVSGLERPSTPASPASPAARCWRSPTTAARPASWPKAKPKPGAPVKTTIDPGLQEAAVSALAGRSGGVAVLDARNGDVRALAGQAFSAPQPPGSTFKMITTTAALQKRRRLASTTNSKSPTASTSAAASSKTPTASTAAAPSAKPSPSPATPDFAPLGPGDRQRQAGRNGGTVRLQLAADPLRAADRPRSRTRRNRPSRPKSATNSTSASRAIGQGEVLATPLEMASVAQTIANDGVREPTSIVANRKLRPDAEPVRVMSKKIADELTELMIGVVTGGTGTAGAIPEAQVAGKTGTAELGPEAGRGERGKPGPDQGRLVRRLRPGRKAEAGGRGAADRSRSRGRRSRGAGRVGSALGRALSRRPALEVERYFGPSSPSAPWMWRVSGRFSEASSGSRKRTSEPSIGPCWGVESSTGICSSASTSPPNGKA